MQGLIDRTDGVVASNLDFNTGIAQIYVAKDWGFDVQKLEDELMYRGYTLLVGTGHETVHMRRMKNIAKKQNKTQKKLETGLLVLLLLLFFYDRGARFCVETLGSKLLH